MKKVINKITRNCLLTISICLLTTGCGEVIKDNLHSIKGRNANIGRFVFGPIDWERKIGTLAVDAKKRLVVSNLITGDFCSEPPPEVADSLSSSITAAIEKDNQINVEFAKSFAQYANSLYKRSHAVQFFRDAAYNLCIQAMNETNIDLNKLKETKDGTEAYEKALDMIAEGRKYYKQSLLKLIEDVQPTLKKEIEEYYKVELKRAENPAPVVNSETVICNTNASIGGKDEEDKPGKLSTSVNCLPLSDIINKGNEQEK